MRQVHLEPVKLGRNSVKPSETCKNLVKPSKIWLTPVKLGFKMRQVQLDPVKPGKTQ